MTAATAIATPEPATADPAMAATGVDVRTRATWLIPAGLFLLALLIRLAVIPLASIAPTEGSAYYVGVAANLVDGHGLVSDAVWSYATAPHVVPKPAFELWMPLASFVAAVPMLLTGTAGGAALAAAQAGMALLGALAAPFAWWIGRDAGRRNGLDARRTRAVAITSGLLAAVLAPFVVAIAGPESSTPFLVAGMLAGALLPAAVAAPAAPTRARRLIPGLALGLVLGLAWLARQEAIWLGVSVLVLAVVAARAAPASRGRTLLGILGPVIVGGLVAVAPWLLRDLAVFGSPFPGQSVENLWLRRNEDIFAWADRPTAAAYLARGAGALIGDRVDALFHQVISVLLLPPFPVGLAGAVAAVVLRRSPGLRGATPLALLLLSGLLTFLATALLFPIATQWGTFLHASGPLLAGLIVTTALGGDALMARISARRRWPKVNVIVAPIALLALAVPLLALQLLVVARGTDRIATRLALVATDVQREVRGAMDQAGAPAAAPSERRPTLLTDHPMWLAAATGWPAAALPDEPSTAVGDLAGHLDASWIVLMDPAGRQHVPDEADPAWAACLDGAPIRVGPADDPAWLLRIGPGCRHSS
ncbi:MAG: hypothetical protein U0869_14840 [Chloroflexota bacterium]